MDEIKHEVRKLEKLAQHLEKVVKTLIEAKTEQPPQQPGRVVKPEASQELEQLCWRLNAQQTRSSGGELEPERAGDTNNANETPPKIPMRATIETPEQKAPGIIPPKQPSPV